MCGLYDRPRFHINFLFIRQSKFKVSEVLQRSRKFQKFQTASIKKIKRKLFSFFIKKNQILAPSLRKMMVYLDCTNFEFQESVKKVLNL